MRPTPSGRAQYQRTAVRATGRSPLRRVGNLVRLKGICYSPTFVMSNGKIKSLPEMLEIREELRRAGQKLCFTNGCFDILHLGHIRYLNRARAMGDALAVALNSDRSVRHNKGEARPVVPQQERAEVLAALACVDYVCVFDENTPQRIIDALVPDVLVKGADWGLTDIVGRETVENAGGIVRNIPLVEGSSTTGIISRILERFGSSSKQPAGRNSES